MYISTEIHYIASGNRSLQKNSFQSRGKKSEYIAYQWWKQIKKEMSYHTELVKDLEKQEWNRHIKDDLPF